LFELNGTPYWGKHPIGFVINTIKILKCSKNLGAGWRLSWIICHDLEIRRA